MTTKAAFNAEEWSVIANAPFLTAMLVIAADRGGTVRETMAITRAYASTREEQADGLLREAVEILNRVADEDEVIAYKRFVYAVADKVARAHREGGFLGFGGTEVSEHEQAALDEIAAIFDET
jgi:hypothetical protein